MSLPANCHLIAVVGGKGGVGKSVFAANLACAIMNEMRAKTLLIDADARSCGDQSVITGLRPLKTVREIAQFNGAINPQSLKALVAQHASGLGYIGAVHSPEELLDAPAELVRKQMFALGQNFQFIVADLGNDLGDLQLGLIADASVVLVVTTPEVLVVNQTRRLINDLGVATVPSDLVQVVINKSNKGGLAPQAIGQSLKRPVVGIIPQDDITSLNALQRSQPFMLTQANTPMGAAYTDLVRKLTGGLLQKLKSLGRPSELKGKTPLASAMPMTGAPAPQITGRNASRPLDPMTQLKISIHTELIKEMDLKKDLTQTRGDANKERDLRQKTQQVISTLVDRMGAGISREDRTRIIREVLDEALGLGPLEDLLADSTVTEIMVNGFNQIFAEKHGKLQLTQVTFTSNLQLRNVIERIVTPIGRRIDEKTPYVDARLADGSRVNAVIEPLSIDGPALTIRKFAKDRITMDDYVGRFGTLTKPMADFLRICVEEGLNIIISGGTGSGKTTLLNVLSGYIPANERIITIEDAAELQLKQEHVVRLETRPANMEGTGDISIRDLVRNSLRMRPDRIVVGECRDGAALDMLAAMNTGHDGSMTTVHANTPREGISRLETLCLMAGMDLPVRAIREQIAGAVDLIVQIGRLSDGSRKVKSITEVVGMQGEAVTLQEIFRFKEEGFDKNRKIVGQFQAMGLIPSFIEEFERKGVVIPRNLFTTTNTATTTKPGAEVATKPALANPLRRPPTVKKASGEEG